jgi:ubiquinone/menaquinone biosynthesis C-methylase UbiE
MSDREEQRRAFIKGEGDAWFKRNVGARSVPDWKPDTDPIVAAINNVGLKPTRILEIGCANGQRLDYLRQAFDADCAGIDPSGEAIDDGGKRYPALDLRPGTAEALPHGEAAFDLVIFGFCLYLCDRADLFRIATEADRVLADRGFLTVLDFKPTHPYRNAYAHLGGLHAYKMDYARLFSWNPQYKVIYSRIFEHEGSEVPRSIDTTVGVDVLLKDPASAYSNGPGQ